MDSVSLWIDGLKKGDDRAAQEIWNRYFDQLTRLAVRKLRDAPRRVADEEDVALAAFDSFCRGARQGKFPVLEDRDDLWQLLVVLTARKAADQIAHDRRQKRGGGGVRGESAFLHADAPQRAAGIDQFHGAEPSPEFAAQVAEHLSLFLDSLDDPALRRIAILKLENHSHQEIAADLGVSEETIRRKLQRIKATLAKVLGTDPRA